MIEKFLEATNLKTTSKLADIKKLIADAREKQYLGVCTYLHWACSVNSRVGGSSIIQVYVVGFPTGHPIAIKKDLEILPNTENTEFDVVIPLQYVILNKYKEMETLLNEVRETVGKERILKTIIETAMLTEDKFQKVIEVCENSGADIIKTNTGNYPRIRTLENDIELIKKYTQLPIKASGGISSYIQAKGLIDIGVTRIGTSNPNKILLEEIEEITNG